MVGEQLLCVGPGAPAMLCALHPGTASKGLIVLPCCLPCVYCATTLPHLSLEAAMQPKGGAMGWQLVSSSVAASVDPQPREGELSQVVFGPFLGAGSYGRWVSCVVAGSRETRVLAAVPHHGRHRGNQTGADRHHTPSTACLSCCTHPHARS